MRLESVRCLKQELFATAWTRHAITRQVLPGAGAEVAAALPSKAPSPIALGIEGRNGDYRLAVRILEVIPGLQRYLDQIVRRSRGEVDLRIVGRVVKQQSWQRLPSRPPLPGSSTGHPNVAAGTLGGFVTTGDADLFLLSNNHVLADENRAGRGDCILQPSPADGGRSPQDRVALLSDFVPLDRMRKNRVDAALARLDEEWVGSAVNVLSGLGPLQGLRHDPLQGGEAVAKIGRTTGVTRGWISAFELDDLWVDYDMGKIGFDGQLEIEADGESAFSLGGDSGALVVDSDLRAVGLVFAGNGADISYANVIQDVLQALGARFP